MLSALTPKAEVHMPVVRAALSFPRARRWPCALGITPSPPFSPTPSAQVYDKLVELKADLTAKANDGTTVLMHASMGGLTEVFPFFFLVLLSSLWAVYIWMSLGLRTAATASPRLFGC